MLLAHKSLVGYFWEWRHFLCLATSLLFVQFHSVLIQRYSLTLQTKLCWDRLRNDVIVRSLLIWWAYFAKTLFQKCVSIETRRGLSVLKHLNLGEFIYSWIFVSRLPFNSNSLFIRTLCSFPLLGPILYSVSRKRTSFASLIETLATNNMVFS